MFREKAICDAIRTAYLHLFPDKKERKRALSRLDLELVAQGVRYRGENVLAYFERVETDHMDVIRDSIENRAEAALDAQRELPLYRHDAAHAREQDDLDLYRASRRAN